jgi:hypothetical protein
MLNWLFGGIFGGDASPDSNITDTSSPIVNIDGTPMVGGIDIHGNPFGVTDTTSSLFDDHLSTSILNNSGIHSGIGCDDIFNSTSCFDDAINTGIGCGGLFDD